MIIKFCFNNEIHRCTKPPTAFSSLEPFLKSMFHSGLPSEIVLYYSDSSNENTFLTSQESYENMINIFPNTTVKVFIIQKEVESEPSDDEFDSEVIEDEEDRYVMKSDDYEVINQPKLPAEEANKDTEIIDKPEEMRVEIKEDVVEDIDNMIASTAESRVYDSICSLGEIPHNNGDNLKQLIHDTLKQELPNVVNEVKEELTRRGSVDLENSMREASKVQNVLEKKKDDGVIDQIVDFGKELSDSLKDFPEAFVDMIDDISCLIMGDPKYFYAGDRYPKSIIMKTEQMRRLFPDVHPRRLADFISEMPKAFSFEEIVNAYLKTTIAEEMRRQQIMPVIV